MTLAHNARLRRLSTRKVLEGRGRAKVPYRKPPRAITGSYVDLYIGPIPLYQEEVDLLKAAPARFDRIVERVGVDELIRRVEESSGRPVNPFCRDQFVKVWSKRAEQP